MRRYRLSKAMAATPLAMALLAASAPAVARAAAPTLALDIPAGSLARALQLYAAVTHRQLLYTSELVSGRSVSALHGRYTPDEALQILLLGSRIDVEQAGQAVLLRKHSPYPDARMQKTSEPVAAHAPDAFPAPAAFPQPSSPSPVQPDGVGDSTVSEVVITGTHIRGIQSSASPVVTLTRDEISKDGNATVGEALARLPQAFNGVQNTVNSLNGSDKTGTNIGYAQGVNLRGLGAGATLVLLNGRRLAGTGNLANFVDVSAVPSAAVDHVEVLLDGASAIYGSDAVAGVVNIITKSKYEGADTTVRYGVDEGGVAGATQATQTLGYGWTGGHLLATYDYQHSDSLASSERPQTRDSDLRPLGGTNHDAFNANPGNILGLNAAGSGYVPVYAIPAGSGVGLKPSDFTAGAINLLNVRHNTDLTPDLDQSAFFMDVSQSLGPRTTVDLEARYNLRHFQARQSPSQSIISVSPKNPYYVTPNGAASELIGYSLDQVIGPEIQDSRSKSYDVSLGLDRDIGRTWRISGYLGYAGEEAHSYIRGLFNSGNLNEALGNTPDSPATPFSTAVDGFFNPYGSGSQNSQLLRNFIGDGASVSTDFSSTSTASIQADGELFTLPAGPVRAAFGGQYRHERLQSAGVDESVGPNRTRRGGANFNRDVSAVFGELNIPLVAPSMGAPGVHRLDLSIAGRIEHYDDVGDTQNPKVGLSWAPVEDVTLNVTYGTSFRAPSLSEIAQPELFAPLNLSSGGATTLVLLQYGGNTGLQPETATTWTTGLTWTPKFVPGLRLGVTGFDIDFTNEIGNPGITYYTTILNTPALASLVTRINTSKPADLALINAALSKAAGSSATLFPATAYGAIIDARYLNTASEHLRGLDFNADYAFTWGRNAIALSAVGSYLDTFSRRQVAGGPLITVLNTPNQPVDFRGRASVDWSRGPYEARATLNYVDSYKDPVALRAVDAWTTLDLALIWRAPQSTGLLRGATASVYVRNLLGADPPFYDNPQAIGYDSANADVFGRVLSVELTKHW